MLTVLLFIIAFGCNFIAYCVGYLRGMDENEEKYSARVIRPANITINNHYTVTEYTVQDGALDIDFPNTRSAL